MPKYTIAWLPGDGVGNDVMEAARIILDAMKFDAKYKHIPVIMLTSRETPDHEKIGRDTGADAYVYKSDRKGTLLKLVQEYLNQG